MCGNQCRSRWSCASASSWTTGSSSVSEEAASLACSRKAGTHCSSTSVTTPSAPSPTRAAAKTSGSSSAEQASTDPSASTSVSPLTAAAMPWSRVPVPWVPVAIAPLIVCRSMSPRFGRARPSAWSAGLSTCSGVPASTRTRRRSRSTPMTPLSPPRRSSMPSVATSGVKECPEPATRTRSRRAAAPASASTTPSVVSTSTTSAGVAVTLPPQFRHSFTRSSFPHRGTTGPTRRARPRRRGARRRTARAAHPPSPLASTPGHRAGCRPRPAPAAGVCTSPAASVRRSEWSSCTGEGTRDHPGCAAGDVAPAERRDVPGRRPAHDGQGEGHRRPRREVVVAVEERRPVEPGAGGHLGDDRVPPEQVEASGPAGVDEAQRGLAAHGIHDGAPSLRELAHAAALERADVRAGIRQSGDLGVVGHQTPHVEPDTHGRPHHREGIGRRARRGAADAEVQPAHPERGVDVERDAEPGRVGPERVAQPAHVLDRVDRDGDLRPQPVVRRHGSQRDDVDRRVGDEDVTRPALDEPHRLGHGVRHDAGEAGAGEHAVEQGAAAHGLGRHPDRQPTGPPDQVVGVGVEGVEVDRHERCGEPRRRARPLVRARHGADPSAMLTR